MTRFKIDENKMSKTYNVGIVGLLFLIILLHPFIGQASTRHPANSSGDIERSCRVKAKEVAAIAYKNCVTDTKNAQVEKLNKEFSQKIKNVKEEYERELARVSGKKVSKNQVKTPQKSVKSENVSLENSAEQDSNNSEVSSDTMETMQDSDSNL